jgi:dTDP-4-amino-4,6-dideoxygalactose transaminase
MTGPARTETVRTPPETNAGARVPLMDPRRTYAEWGPAAEADLVAILRSGTYVKGPHVAAFESEFAAYVGTRRAVAVDSGTAALHLVLRAVLDARPQGAREVILPSFTFVATASAVVNAGGKPVFADVLPDTMNLDPASVARWVSDRTAAVVPVHLFGSPVDLPALRAALGGRPVFILEDAAQAIHATVGGRRAGALADAAAFSFYPSKNVGAAGDAGAVTTDDSALADRVAALRDHGQTKKMYDHPIVGTNARMDEIQAAVLRRKMPRVGAWTNARRNVASRYTAAFAGTPVRPQRVLPGAESAWHLYTVRMPRRDAVRAALEGRGIASGVYYPVPLDRQACFAGHAPSPCPVSASLAEEVLSLPCFPGLGEDEQDRVIAAVLDAARS